MPHPKKRTPPRLLTPRQSDFVALYLSGPKGVRFNATRAAEAAGYAWPDKQGPRLLTFRNVDAEVERRFAPILSRARGRM
jgi:phage terminase small subunit